MALASRETGWCVTGELVGERAWWMLDAPLTMTRNLGMREAVASQAKAAGESSSSTPFEVFLSSRPFVMWPIDCTV